MNTITIKEHDDNRIEVGINGNAEALINMLASAIVNDPNFGALILTALVAVAEQKNKFPDINPN